MTYADLRTAATPADAALALAALGHLVFPTHGLRSLADQDGRLVCTCGNAACSRPGKHPASVAPRGLVDATTSPQRLEAWFRKADSHFNVSIRTGRASGLLVIDVAASAVPALKALHEKDGLPETLLARTGNGGLHLFYRYPPSGRWPNTRGLLGRGIDTRGEGGWVIAPPSLHVSGKPYAWENLVPPAEAPSWLLARLRPGRVLDRAEPTVPTEHLADVLSDATATAPEPAPDIQSQLDPYTVAMGDVVGEDVRPALSAYAAELARARLVDETLIALVRRMNDQNCRPPLSSDEADELGYGALAAEHARQARANDSSKGGPIDPTTPEGQRRLAETRRRERLAEPAIGPAVRAQILSYLGVVDFDRDANELGVVWHESREPQRLPLSAEADLQRVVTQFLGNLNTFAARAHQKARAKHVLAALQEFAKNAPARQVEQDDSEPVQLVDQVQAMDIWQNEDVGGYSRPTPKMLAERRGFHHSQGVGYLIDRETGHEILVVNFPRLASGALAKSAQFRSKKASELKKLMEEAPGWIGSVHAREARNRLGDVQLYGVDMVEFSRILGRSLESGGRELREATTSASGSASTTTSTSLWSSEKKFSRPMPQQREFDAEGLEP
jgi:hypothetical protein